MTSQTDLANIALGMIGGTRITQFTDGSNNANEVQNIYDELRDDLTRKHSWNFATKRLKLAQLTEEPAFGFDHAYPLPSDWIKTMSVHDNDDGAGTIVYKTEQVASQICIATDADEVFLRYVSRQIDVNLMPLDFRRALITALARDLAIPVANSNTLRREMADEARQAVAGARSRDGTEGTPERRPRGSWVASRQSGLPPVSAEGD